jgi:hypothetical protein
VAAAPKQGLGLHNGAVKGKGNSASPRTGKGKGAAGAGDTRRPTPESEKLTL